MTLDELLAREAIRETMAKYNTSGDRLKVEDYVCCFTEDGIMESDGVPEDKSFHYAGRAEIRAWQSRWRHRDPNGAAIHGATFIRHHLSTCKIDITGPEAARARTYWVAWTDIGPDHAGYYLDEFRKVGEEWLIAHRRVRLDWESGDSLFKAVIAQTNPVG